MDVSEPHVTDSQPAVVTPMLRTVLLCDIVESTALVERLGDVRAVSLLQRHDQLLHQALALCHGRLIDKADGVLALFERPIQALDFALRYQRGLRELGGIENLDLKARIGLHVGDVMTWPNSPKDVLAGAKAFEVEGLAKPVAARLMGLALPGQILMSGMAQNLCQRAVGELGEAGGNLRWLLHGRYSFKGVPAPMLIHEVGEPGLSPLRAPDSGAKAWRELPLWRRPPVLALEVLVVGALGLALFWTTLRSPPAIAFAERDWVVVADLQNRTDEPLFDDSLDTALRIGLEQSRHVNLISELQIDRALERMQRQGQPVDRQVAAELALREGAKAVILPTIAEVGGRVRVSLEVVDPNSGVTVFSTSSDGRGANAVLPALDEAMASVRSQLGESIGSIQSSSLPLEQVTTQDLEALRAFTLGVKARLRGNAAEAMGLYREAVKLDPEFSMAWLRMGAVELANDLDLAKQYFERAAATRERLTRRENLVLDASLGLLGPPGPMLEEWKRFASLYPDEYRAHFNYSYFAYFKMQRYQDAVDAIGPALSPSNPARIFAFQLQAANLMALGRLDESVAAFQQADSLGLMGYKRDYADLHAAQRDYLQAQRVLGTQAVSGQPGSVLNERLAEVSHPLDQGRWQQAQAALASLSAVVGPPAPELVRHRHRLMQLSLRSYAPDPAFKADLREFLTSQEAALPSANALARPHVQFQWLAAGWMAANAGDLGSARHALARCGDEALNSGFPFSADMARLVQAEIDLAEGKPRQAIERLAPRAKAGDALYFLHAVLMRAHAAAGDAEAALVQAEWLASQRGLVFAEPNSDFAWQLVNIVESNLALAAAAQLAEQLGRNDLTLARRQAFAEAWPYGDLLPAVERRQQSLD